MADADDGYDRGKEGAEKYSACLPRRERVVEELVDRLSRPPDGRHSQASFHASLPPSLARGRAR